MVKRPFTQHEEDAFRQSYASGHSQQWQLEENVGRLLDTLDYERKLHAPPQTGLPSPLPWVSTEDAKFLFEFEEWWREWKHTSGPTWEAKVSALLAFTYRVVGTRDNVLHLAQLAYEHTNKASEVLHPIHRLLLRLQRQAQESK